MSSSPQFAGPVRQFSLRRLLAVMLLLIGSVLALGSVVERASVKAAALVGLTVSGASKWATTDWNPDPLVIGGTTGAQSQSIRISFETGKYEFFDSACSSMAVATVNGAAATCDASPDTAITDQPVFLSITLPTGVSISAGSGFSVTISAGKIKPKNAAAFDSPVVTVATYAGDHQSAAVIDQGTVNMVPEVTFHANNQTGATTSALISLGETLPRNAFDPPTEGYTFKGWGRFATDIVQFSDEASYAKLYGTQWPLDLYALWQAPASIQPSPQQPSGTEGQYMSVTFTSSAGFTPTNFAITSGTLPAGLNIDPNSGMISGVPSASSSAQVTVTATAGQTTASATITFNIAAAPPSIDLSVFNGYGNTSRNGTVGSPLDPPLVIRTRGMSGPVAFTAVNRTITNTYVLTSLPPGLSIVTTSATAAQIVGTPTGDGSFTFYIAASDNGAADVYSSDIIIIRVSAATETNTGGTPVFVPAPVNSDTTPPTSAPEGVGESGLITEQRQEQLTSSAGDGKVLVNGELVDATVTQASAELRSSDPTQRSPQQVTELQDLAASILDQVSTALGGGTGSLSVRNTPTGAVILGLATDPVTGQPMEVPVENVVFVSGGGLVLVASGIDGRSPARIGLDGSVEIPEGGYVSIVAGGLTPGENGEVVVMSTPRLIGSFDVGESGDVREQAALPTDLGSGSHTLVVTVGDEAASLGFRVIPNGVRPTLPVTGGSNDLIVVWSLAFLVAGALVLALDRRRHLFTH